MTPPLQPPRDDLDEADQSAATRGHYRLAPGSPVHCGRGGDYEVLEVLDPPTRDRPISRVFLVRVKKAPASEVVAEGSSVNVGDLKVLKLHSYGKPAPHVFSLPDNGWFVKPIVRSGFDRYSPFGFDLFDKADIDLSAWWVNAGRKVDEDDFWALALALMWSLVQAHEAGIVHGDMKMSQWLLDESGWRLSDWDGAVRTADLDAHSADLDDGEATSGMAGDLYTDTYRPPGVARGRYKPRYDVWALLVCLHELLAGEHVTETHAGRRLSNREKIDLLTKGSWAISDALPRHWQEFFRQWCDASLESGSGKGTGLALEVLKDLRQITWDQVGTHTNALPVCTPLGDERTFLVTVDGDDDGAVSVEQLVVDDTNPLLHFIADRIPVAFGAERYVYYEVLASALERKKALEAAKAQLRWTQRELEKARNNRQVAPVGDVSRDVAAARPLGPKKHIVRSDETETHLGDRLKDALGLEGPQLSSLQRPSPRLLMLLGAAVPISLVVLFGLVLGSEGRLSDVGTKLDSLIAEADSGSPAEPSVSTSYRLPELRSGAQGFDVTADFVAYRSSCGVAMWKVSVSNETKKPIQVYTQEDFRLVYGPESDPAAIKQINGSQGELVAAAAQGAPGVDDTEGDFFLQTPLTTRDVLAQGCDVAATKSLEWLAASPSIRTLRSGATLSWNIGFDAVVGVEGAAPLGVAFTGVASMRNSAATPTGWETDPIAPYEMSEEVAS